MRIVANNAIVSVAAQKSVPAGTVLHNMNGSSGISPRCKNCDSWIKHWQRLSGQSIPANGDCAVLWCSGQGEAMEGCHVTIVGSADKSTYIAPLCKSCNARHGKKLILKRSITLVKANVDETCSKLISED